MTRQGNWFVLITAILVAFASAQTLFAQTVYNIGIGQTYSTLKDLHDYISATQSGILRDAELVFFNDDSSWDDTLYSFDVRGTVELRSSELGERRTISTATDEFVMRLFQVYGGTLTVSSDFTLSGINSSASGTMSGHSGGIINVNGVIFENNYSAIFGGGIDTYGENTINAVGAVFRNNTGSRGGGVEVFYSKSADFTDAIFLDNSAFQEPGGAIIIIGNSYADRKTTVTLGASDENVSLFQGNKFTDPFTLFEQANSLYIYMDGTYDINVETTGTGELHMLDPIYLTPGYDYTATFTKTGTGTWFLGGDNRINTGTGRASFVIEEGVFQLNKDTEIYMTGANDSLTVKADATVGIDGDNVIQGTTVIFEHDAILNFDAAFYRGRDKEDPMLYLAGTTLVIDGTTIAIRNLPDVGDIDRNGDYHLIHGSSPLEAGNFNLFIGSDKIDVSGEVSERFGYSLGNTVDVRQLILRIRDQENAIVQWQNNTDENYRDIWSIRGMNWTLPYRFNMRDGFVPGDTVVFDDMRGDQTIQVAYDSAQGYVIIAPVADSGYTFYEDNGIGMHVGGEANWTFVGNKIADGYDPELAGVPVNDAKKAALYYTGSGSLRLENDEPNEFHGNVIHAGTGIIYVSQLDRYGLGDAFEFWDNSVPGETSKVVFTDTQIFDRQFVVKADGDGHVTNADAEILILTSEAAAIADVDGGKLTFEGTSRESFAIIDNVDKNITVKNGGEFVVKTAIISGNSIASGSFISATGGSKVVFEDVLFENNTAAGSGYAVSVTDSTLHLIDSQFVGGSPIRVSAQTSNASLLLDASNGKTVDTAPLTLSAAAGLITTVNKTGAGTWNVNGVGTSSGNGTVSLTVSEGTVAMSKGSSLAFSNGTVTLREGTTLFSTGGNRITANTLRLENNSTLAFDLDGLTGKAPLNEKLLDVQARVNTLPSNVNIDLLNLSLEQLEKGDDRTFNLAYLRDGFTAASLGKMTVLFDGVDVRAMRQNLAVLTYNDSTKILAVDITAPIVGLTQWDNDSTSKVWNQTAHNWIGTNRAEGKLEGTTQFLSGDAVEFIGGNGSQVIAVDING
ncbi:MAG: hypothetical protein FWE67_11180, partial [Planctomycetaceae bacterium]|nr:hypothetical protein [Planctomycetaceae bacterium]